METVWIAYGQRMDDDGEANTTLDEALAAYPGAVTFTFGDSRALCDELLATVGASARPGAETLERLGWHKLHDLLDDFGEDDRGPTPVLAARLYDVLLARGGSEKHEEAAAVAALLGSRSAAAAQYPARHRRVASLTATLLRRTLFTGATITAATAVTQLLVRQIQPIPPATGIGGRAPGHIALGVAHRRSGQ